MQAVSLASWCMQEQDVISQKAARQSGVKHKGSKPRCSKKRKKNETAGRAEADSGNQPEAEAAALRQPSQDVPMQWGGKQKRKHIRQASSGLPDQACRASQQRLLRPYSDTPVADHPSEGPSCPAVKPSATSAAGVLCDAKG